MGIPAIEITKDGTTDISSYLSDENEYPDNGRRRSSSTQHQQQLQQQQHLQQSQHVQNQNQSTHQHQVRVIKLTKCCRLDVFFFHSTYKFCCIATRECKTGSFWLRQFLGNIEKNRIHGFYQFYDL